MRASTSVILCLLAAVCGYFLGMFAYTWEVMTSLTVIAMGGCIIHTINKNFEQLRKDLKEQAKKDEPENN